MAQQNMLRAFGQDIDTPAGTLRGIFRDAMDDTRLGRKGQPGLNLPLSQPVLHVTEVDAQNLSPGDALTIEGQSLVIGPGYPKRTALGLIRYLLVPNTEAGPWR